MALKANSKSVQSIARLSHADACEFLFDRPKRNQKALSPDAIRHGCAVPVPCAPRLTRHAAQTRFAQTWAALRPRQAAVLGSLYGSIRQKLKAKAKARATATAKCTPQTEADNASGGWREIGDTR